MGRRKNVLKYDFVRVPQPLFEPTNIIRVGDTLIDTWHVKGAGGSAWAEPLESGFLEGVTQVIITHPHVDHVTASASFPQLAEMPHIVFKGAELVIRNIVQYLSDSQKEGQEILSLADKELGELTRMMGNVIFPWDRTYLDVNISRLVQSGDEIRAGEVVLKAIHTPRHEANHMMLFHEPSGTLFSGDLVRNNARFSRAPRTPNLADYERSLRLALDLNPKLIVPSHGDVIENPIELINKCLANVQDTKRRILDFLANHKEASHADIAKGIFEVADQLHMMAVSSSMWGFFEGLEEEGKIVFDRDRGLARLP